MGDAAHEAGVIRRLAAEVLFLLLVRDDEGHLLGSSPPVHLDPAPIIRRDQRSVPKTDLGGSQLVIGKLQHDAAHVLVGEEVAARELKVVQSTPHVVKEGVATPAREKAIVASLRNLRFWARRHRSILDDRFSAVSGSGGVSALDAAHRRTMRPILVRREPDPISDVRESIPVGVDLELVYRLRRERLIRGAPLWVYAHSRMRVHDDDRPAWVLRLREGEQVAEVDAGITLRAGEIRSRVMV